MIADSLAYASGYDFMDLITMLLLDTHDRIVDDPARRHCRDQRGGLQPTLLVPRFPKNPMWSPQGRNGPQVE
jgi:hypothetical protein